MRLCATGASSWSRTSDLAHTKGALCQLSYQGDDGATEGIRTPSTGRRRTLFYPLNYSGVAGQEVVGADGWGRTSDTRIFNPVLYQLSYDGEE